MKIQFVRNISVDLVSKYENTPFEKAYRKWDVISVQSVNSTFDPNEVNITLDNGDILTQVPKNSFTNLDKRTVISLDDLIQKVVGSKS